jgi:hypothetical protein
MMHTRLQGVGTDNFGGRLGQDRVVGIRGIVADHAVSVRRDGGSCKVQA